VAKFYKAPLLPQVPALFLVKCIPRKCILIRLLKIVEASKEIFTAALPPLLSHYEQENRLAHKQSLLDLIVHFVDSTKQGQGT